MGKVVKMESYSEAYMQALKEALAGLEQFEQYLFSRSVDILMAGKWKQWSDEQPVGTVFNFRDKEMREAGDRVVDELLDLKDLVRERRRKIGKNLKIK